MEIYFDYTKALMEVEMRRQAYEKGTPFPILAQKFIEMGKAKGLDITIKYGMKKDKDGEGRTVGYFIHCLDKAIFQQDIYMEDESENNIAKGVEWFEDALTALQKQLWNV